MIMTKKIINVFAVNMYLKNPGANESLHLVVSELLPKRLVSLDKVCISPWHTLSKWKFRITAFIYCCILDLRLGYEHIGK